jgi:processing peptidase subunit alpha
MLSKLLRPRAIRRFASAPSWNVVKFVKEDPEKVLQEVPDVNYYVFSEAEPYPYRDVPMHEPIDLPSAESPVLKSGDLAFSKLENGLRIASVDRQGLTATLTLTVRAGSRWESAEQTGISDFVQRVAFQSTAHLSSLRQVKTLEALGAHVSVSLAREFITYEISVLREFLPIASTLLVGNILFPRLLEWDVNLMRQKFEKQLAEHQAPSEDTNALIEDLLHQTAFHNNTLGRRMWASEGSIDRFTPEAIREYMLERFSMDNVVFSAVNADHAELCKWLSRAFAEYTVVPPMPGASSKVSAPEYTGGYSVREAATGEQTHVAVGFLTGGWKSQNELVTGSVLQTLLGGGGSYSTGGPGKGMHSRLYLDVLNTKHYVDHIQAFNTVHSDAGLFGLSISGEAKHTPKLVQVIQEQLAKVNKFTTEEINRAKSSLKGNLFSSSENGKAMAEDAGKQLLMTGEVVTVEEFAKKIDQVTEKDLIEFTKKLLEHPVSMVVYGNTAYAPHHAQVQKLFDSLKSKISLPSKQPSN